MPRVRIHHDQSIDEERLKQLLEEAGCPVSDEEESEPAEGENAAAPGAESIVEEALEQATDEDEEAPCDPDVLVIVLTSAACASNELENELKRTANSQCRVVGIWPEDAEDGSALP